MENFKNKTPEELNKQLGRAEVFFGNKIQPENIREELLSLSLDEIKKHYPKEYQSYFAFLQMESQLFNFPDMEIYNKKEKPTISRLNARTRGGGNKINFLENSRVVKPLESSAEKKISDKASALGIGPKQFKTKEGYLHEEFIEGTSLLTLEKEKCTPEFMEDLGRKFYRVLKKLHENNILVNDQILTDDFGKSHMILDKKGDVRFIDFGASIDLANFPNISDEEVMSLMRTDPYLAFQMFNILNAPEEQQKIAIKGYRDKVLSKIKNKQDLINMKDMQLLNEGLSFLMSRLPNAQYFVEGIKKEL